MLETCGTAESVARFAGLLADRSRVVMCLAMLDGRAWTVGELARQAGIGPPTASEHLTMLVDAGLLAEERQGRHRYVRLAGPAVAQLVEDLAAVVGVAERPASLHGVRAAQRLAAARTCYDHLAGVLGVSLFDGLVARDLLSVRDGLALTAAGREWFVDLAGADALRQRGTRPLLRSCLDWTERRPHLSGSVGAALCHQMLERGWIVRAVERRGIAVTPAGADAIHDLFGVTVAVAGASTTAAATAPAWGRRA